MITVKGLWVVVVIPTEDTWHGENDCFLKERCSMYQVKIEIDGDFESPKQKLEYANEIARRLNTFNEVKK